MSAPDGRVTVEQAEWLLAAARRHDLVAVKIGIGSNGYPPCKEGWVLLASGRSVWLAPDGSTEPSA